MSEPLDDPTLDTLIDDAARSLMAERVPVDLRARVFERIRVDADRGWKRRWFVPGVAIASACIAAVAIYVGAGFSRSDDVNPSSPSQVLQKPAALSDVGSGFSRSVDSEIRQKPDPTVTSMLIVESDPPAGIEPIVAPGLTIDALGVAALAPPDALSVESIPLESIEVSALGTD